MDCLNSQIVLCLSTKQKGVSNWKDRLTSGHKNCWSRAAQGSRGCKTAGAVYDSPIEQSNNLALHYFVCLNIKLREKETWRAGENESSGSVSIAAKTEQNIKSWWELPVHMNHTGTFNSTEVPNCLQKHKCLFLNWLKSCKQRVKLLFISQVCVNTVSSSV